MDDPTKDTIPRSAVEYCLRKETVSTNPEKYKTHEKFIDYMNDPDISEFGHWMHSNGFNCALTAISVDLKKIPSVTPSSQPGWIPCSERMPDLDEEGFSEKMLVSFSNFGGLEICEYRETDEEHGWYVGDSAENPEDVGAHVIAWMPLPDPPSAAAAGGEKDDGPD